MQKSLCIICLLLLVAGVPFAAFANPLQDGDVPVDYCSSLRLPGNCKPAPLSAEDNAREATLSGNQLEFKRKLKLPAQAVVNADNACEAEISISYAQRNDKVKVESEIRNDTCAASHGEYVVRMHTLNMQGESKTTAFPAQWSRLDAAPLHRTNYYPMGDGKDLLWVRVKSNRKTRCFCAEPTE